MTKWVWFLVFITVVFVELGVAPALEAPWRFLTLAPLGILGFAVAGWKRAGLAAAASSGLIFDAFSALPAGTYLILFLSVFWVSDRLFRRWFTNRSWLSLITLALLVVTWFLILLLAWRFLLFGFTRSLIYAVSIDEAGSRFFLGIVLSVLTFAVGLFVRDLLKFLLPSRSYVRKF